jgi:gas vesicle protein
MAHGHKTAMTKNAGLPIFVAGIGIGVAATLFMMDRELRTRLGKSLSERSQSAADALSDPATWKRGEKAMSDVKDKLKNQVDDAADATKKAVDKVVDKSKDAAHKAGEHLERGGKRLQNA